jgi:hypothetical protein
MRHQAINPFLAKRAVQRSEKLDCPQTLRGSFRDQRHRHGPSVREADKRLSPPHPLRELPRDAISREAVMKVPLLRSRPFNADP